MSYYFAINITYVKGQSRSISQLSDRISSSIQAGLKKDTFGVSAQMCLQPAERGIGTPEHIKKYRKSFKEQHGVTIVLFL